MGKRVGKRVGDRGRTSEIERERAIEKEKSRMGLRKRVGKGGKKSGIEREIKKVEQHPRYLQ